ncbi:chemotaxis protein CheW [Chitinimonas taiwanensis]|uniref:Purine-binding chemotaxis protein CheW n=1 Tax=Chitinimonas taiwanensis DSM 18899 TaxID=1121279 RepID=A0A1K2HRP4_9NEIS|nr:chemotaxis protein CheW [Chitinimonas taiwanensis]SFZ79484.1 purine-binding chemotaxis protein CheW [Chitinimonas taiwanensis DSM 18899]
MMRDEQAHWQALHAQIDQLAQQLAQADSLSAEQVAATLASRARQWAAAPPVAATDLLSVLVFGLGEHRYAFALEHVDEVLPLRQLTVLPGTPPFVRGIANVRGRILAVLDLACILERPPAGLAERTYLLVLQSAEMEFGLLVDRVLGVQQLARSAIQTQQAGLSGLARQLIIGISPEQWTVLDGARLLAEPSLCIEDRD